MATRSSKTVKLKVLTLVSGDLWAGAETMACNLLRRLKCYDDLELSVILLNRGRLADELLTSGLTVYVLDEGTNSFWEILQKIKKIIGSKPPDIIHSHRYKENLLALLSSSSCPGIQLCSTQHGLPELEEKMLMVSQRLIARTNFWALSRFFTTVTVSKDICNVLVSRFGFRKENIEVIHNGVELPPSPSYRGNAGSLVIGSSGRLFPVKDYPLMVEIARAVVANGVEDVRFELAGDGPERPALEALVKCGGLGTCFTFKGHQSDMNFFYSGLDVYLNTSVHEGIPMTILEALAHGLPVIAPAVGGIVEIIDDGTQGFLIGSRSAEEFAKKCLILRDHGEERERMARAAREKAKQSFSAEGMSEQYYQLYRRIVS